MRLTTASAAAINAAPMIGASICAVELRSGLRGSGGKLSTRAGMAGQGCFNERASKTRVLYSDFCCFAHEMSKRQGTSR